MTSSTPLFRSCWGQVHPRAAIQKRRQQLWQPEHLACRGFTSGIVWVLLYFLLTYLLTLLDVFLTWVYQGWMKWLRPPPLVFCQWMSHVTQQILLTHTHTDDVYGSTDKWPSGVVNGKCVYKALHSFVTAQNNGLTNGRCWGSNRRPCD